jgi:RluA family pseudouridine synthase
LTILYKKFLPQVFEAAYQVNEEQSGMRLDQFLLIYMKSFSREQVKKKIKDGDAKIEGRPHPHRPNAKVYEKEVVVFTIKNTEHEDEYWRGEKLELQTEADIIYENENLYVISKPPYMSTHPTGKHLFNCATVFLEHKSGKPTHSIHRLDRETSGVMLVGKNSKTSSYYGQCFEEELIKKCYFFIAISNEYYKGKSEFFAKERLDVGGEGLRRVYINYHPENSTEGKRAHTEFEIVHTEGNYVLGLAYPQTGRQHQIRVHALAHGLPLLGDKLYLGSYKMFQRFKDLYATKEDHDLMQISRHALHAFALSIPWSDERKVFTSHIPHDLKTWIDQNLKITSEDLEKKLIERVTSGKHLPH